MIEKTIPLKYIPDFRYYKIAENELSKDFLRKIQNSVAALFYAENSSEDELEKEFKILTGLLKKEKPAELSLFVMWFKYMFSDREDLIDEIKEVEEAKTMLRSSIKEMSKRLINEGMEKGIEKGIQKGILKGKLETAAALLNKKMPAKEISEITGLSLKKIEKLKSNILTPAE